MTASAPPSNHTNIPAVAGVSPNGSETTDSPPSVTVIIIGAGIVGLAAAWRLLSRNPQLTLLVLEKEPDICAHQTGRNSGVIHSGIYYKPGSLKAVNCRRGRAMLLDFCKEHGIACELCGKVIVATQESERPRLATLLERGKANGVQCEWINAKGVRDLEPSVTTALEGIHVFDTGIVDYVGVGQTLHRLITEAGGQVLLNQKVTGVIADHSGVSVKCADGRQTYRASYLINCGGLQSDRVARMAGSDPGSQIIPFRGEYYAVKSGERGRQLCRNLIYPVPDPSFPFLGVHLTRMIVDGTVECGPNAVPALAREGYRKLDVDTADLWEMLRFPGFRKLALKHWQMGLEEIWRSISKRAFVRALNRLVPDLRMDDLEEAPSGIRAQSVLADGSMVDDFLFVDSPRVLNVCNAPSPAATSSLSIGDTVVDRLMQLDGWSQS